MHKSAVSAKGALAIGGQPFLAVFVHFWLFHAIVFWPGIVCILWSEDLHLLGQPHVPPDKAMLCLELTLSAIKL